MPARKRGRQEAELDSSIVAIDTTHRKEEENPTLVKLRSMWQFAAFMQYLFLFGRVVKVDDDFDMDVSLIGPLTYYSLMQKRRC